MWDLAASGTLTYAHITNALRIRWGGITTQPMIAARMNRPYMGTLRATLYGTMPTMSKSRFCDTYHGGMSRTQSTPHSTTLALL
jgi:hypothetical protein